MARIGAAQGAKRTQDAVATIKTLLLESGRRLTTDEIQRRSDFEPQVMMDGVQRLLNQGQAKLEKINSEVVVVLLDEAEHAELLRTRDLAPEEALVYQLIEQAANKGIWVKDIRFRSNLTAPRLQKVLKTLEGHNLVKTVKGTASTTKKIYMLFDLQPSEELTGGTWFTDGTLDEDFIENMRSLCLKVVEQKGEMTLLALTKFVSDAGFTSPSLRASHVNEILQTLVFDGLIDEQISDDGESVFVNLIMKQPGVSPLSDIPCGMCPVIHECAEGNDVSPATCEYMNAWLEF